MNNIINNYNKPERIIIEHEIYNYKKDINLRRKIFLNLDIWLIKILRLKVLFRHLL